MIDAVISHTGATKGVSTLFIYAGTKIELTRIRKGTDPFSWYALALSAMILGTSALAETPAPQRQAELRNLLLQDCGSCHGMRLTGGLGPALTPQALQGKPRELLIATVSEGRPGTPMPPWKALLSEPEIAWLVDTLTGGETHP
jgi:cytochrome c55X